MAPPSEDKPRQEPMLEDDDDHDDMTPAAAPGCNAVTLHKQKFAAASMEQDADVKSKGCLWAFKYG